MRSATGRRTSSSTPRPSIWVRLPVEGAHRDRGRPYRQLGPYQRRPLCPERRDRRPALRAESAAATPSTTKRTSPVPLHRHSNWLNESQRLIQAGKYHLFFQPIPGTPVGQHDLRTFDESGPDPLEGAGDPPCSGRLGTMFQQLPWSWTPATRPDFGRGRIPRLVAITPRPEATSRESRENPSANASPIPMTRDCTWTKYDSNPVLKAVGDGDHRSQGVLARRRAVAGSCPYVRVPDPRGRDAMAKPGSAQHLSVLHLHRT